MARNYQLIVFDWDGTLMDSAGAIVASMQAACVDLGLTPPDDRSARQVIGLGLHEALAAALPGVASSEYARVTERYRHHYLSRDHELMLFAGVHELIGELASAECLLGVATGKSRVGLKRVLDGSGLARFFSATRCADECASKPAPDMLLEIMDELGVAPERTLMIGDTTHDLLMARHAGVAALGVAYGAHERTSLEAAAPLRVCDDIEQLAEWLRCHG